MTTHILIIDDEEDIRKLIRGILEDEGYVCSDAANSTQAEHAFEKEIPDLVILDIWLQGSQKDGLEILKDIKGEHPVLPVLMISGHGTIETAVSALKDGAYDFIEKPFKSDRMLLMIQRALENAHLRRENENLRQKANITMNMVGDSPALQNLQQILERAAPTNSRILLMGEAGTGKDIAARFIHENSERANKPYFVLNCATMRPEHLETELFGVEEGVSTQGPQKGVLERANGGTLFLDEVSDMPLETQGKIVRVLQSQSIHKIGGDDEIKIDVRVIASTNKNLEAEIASGNFREDLYYRLSVVPIRVPPLRERIQDIPLLIEYFNEMNAQNNGRACSKFSGAAIAALENYHWPGNIRQVRNVVEWVHIIKGDNKGHMYEVADLPPETLPVNISSHSQNPDEGRDVSEFQSQSFSNLPLREAREEFEKEYLQVQVDRFDGNISKTAQFIGMERSALHRKLKSLQIMPQKKSAPDIGDATNQTKRSA